MNPLPTRAVRVARPTTLAAADSDDGTDDAVADTDRCGKGVRMLAGQGRQRNRGVRFDRTR
jgi:hypothetical protein